MNACFETPEQHINNLIEAPEQSSRTGTVPRMLKLKEAAAETNLSYDILRKWANSKRIVTVHCGNTIFVNMNKLTEFLNRGE